MLYAQRAEVVHASVNGSLGPAFDRFEGQRTVWGPDLASSRFVGVVGGEKFITSDKKLQGPFDEVSRMAQVGYKDGAWLYETRRGHQHSLFLDESALSQRVTPWNVHVLDDRLFLTEQSGSWSGPDYGSKLYDRLVWSGGTELLMQQNAANFLLGADVVPGGWLAYAPVVEMPPGSAQGELRWITGTIDRAAATLRIAVATHAFEVPDTSAGLPNRVEL
jgi:hypothetical protein